MKTVTTYSPLQRLICTICILLMVSEVAAPLAYIGIHNRAEASGPTQSDLVIAATGGDLVDPFTGNFNYSIPLGTVAGTHGLDFPITLSYTSGQTVESEASFVGWGWNTGFGAINRFVNGYPDDAYGIKVEKYNEGPVVSTKTVSIPIPAKFEAFDGELSIQGNIGMQIDNRRGWSFIWSAGFSLPMVTANLSYNNGRTGFSANQSILHMLRVNKMDSETDRLITTGINRISVVNRLTGQSIYPGLSMIDQISSSVQTSKINREQMNINLSFMIGSLFGGSYIQSPEYSSSKMTPVSRIARGYGVMYLAEGFLEKESAPGRNRADTESDEVDFDYGIENDKAYVPEITTDNGIPFLSHDSWAVTGHGPQGSFEVVRSDIGTVEPQTTVHTSPSNNISPELRIPTAGSMELFSIGWSINYNPRGKPAYFHGGHGANKGNKSKEASKFAENNDIRMGRVDGKQNPIKFIYTNDMGASKHQVLPYYQKQNEVGQNYNGGLEDNSFLSFRHGEAEYTPTKTIEYRTFGELFSGISHSYNPRMSIVRLTDYEENWLLEKKTILAIADTGAWHKMIAQMVVTDESGVRYVYSAPVLSSKEQNISVGPKYDTDGTLVESFSNNYIYGNKYYGAVSGFSASDFTIKPSNRAINGQYISMPYVSTFLMTQILSPEYQDLDDINNVNCGPSKDDKGGYLLFKYKSRTTGGGAEIQWRSPLVGGNYSHGNINDQYDDRVSFQRGYREEYYPKQVESKTHIAVYEYSKDLPVTPRQDNKPVPNTAPLSASYTYGEITNGSNNFYSSSVSSAEQSQYLHKIIISKKNGNETKPLQTVNFMYDYSLATGQFNSENRVGKLTLKSVSVDYMYVIEAKHRPYEFSYETPTNTPLGLDPVQSSFLPTTTYPQNPSYNPFHIDPWGYYDPNSFPFVNNLSSTTPHLGSVGVKSQKPQTYDPSVWNLKAIQLPTGGEIRIDYEQKTYTHVQDQEAEVVVSLKSSSVDDSGDYTDGSNPTNSYELDLTKMFGSKVTLSFLNKVKDEIEKKYVQKSEYMYFRFVYSFPPLDLARRLGQIPSPTPEEIIEGFAKVYSVNLNSTNTGIIVKLGQAHRLRRKEDKGGQIGQIGSGTQPVSIAQSMVDANPSLVRSTSINSALSGTKELITGMIQFLIDIVSVGEASGLSNYTPTFKPTESFLRIPIPDEKMGGGVRVRRVLTYSPSGTLEAGDGSVYGIEYQYKEYDQNGILSSYGIAANEPSQFRYDNALKRVLPRIFISGKAIGGDNIEQFVSKPGESLLPSPSIGHSRVIAHNVHVSKNTPGHTIYNFFTVKDKPSVKHNRFPARPYRDIDNAFKPLLGSSSIELKRYESHSFEINSFHGVIKSKMQYAGAYDPNIPAGKIAPVYAEEYEYYTMFEPLLLFMGYDRPLRKGVLGTTHKILLEDKVTNEYSNSSYTQSSLSIIQSPPPSIPIPIPTSFPAPNFDDQTFISSIITHVVSQPPIIRSIKTTNDGIIKKVENRIFDPITGAPVVTSYKDGYDGVTSTPAGSSSVDGSYFNVELPAHYYYENMRPKSEVVRKSFTLSEEGSREHWSAYNVNAIKNASEYEINFNPKASFTASGEADEANELIIQEKEIFNTFTISDHISLSYKMITFSPPSTYTPNYYSLDGYVKKIEKIGSSIKITIENIASTEGAVPSFIGGISDARSKQSITILSSARQNALALPGDSWVLYGMKEWLENLEEYADNLYDKTIFTKSLNRMVSTYGDHLFSGVRSSTPFYNPATNGPQYHSAHGSDNNLLAFYIDGKIYDPLLRARQFSAISNPSSFWSTHTPKLDTWVNPFIRYKSIRSGGNLLFGFFDNYSGSVWPSSLYQSSVSCWDQSTEYKGWFHRRFSVNDDGRLVMYSSDRYPDLMVNDGKLDFRSNLVGVPNRSVLATVSLGSNYCPSVSSGWITTFTPPRFFDSNLWNVVNAQSTSYEQESVLPTPYYRPVWRVKKHHFLRSYTPISPVGNVVPTNKGYGKVSSYFNRSVVSSNPQWILNSEVIKYDDQGLPIESKDRLGIYTSALYTADGQYIITAAKNANSKQIQYIDFTGSFSNYSHSPGGARRLESAAIYSLPQPFLVATHSSDPLSAPKSIVRVWVRGLQFSGNFPDKNGLIISVNPGTFTVSSQLISHVNDWSLIEYVIQQPSANLSGMVTTNVSFTFENMTSQDLYLDDLNISPYESEVNCYSYDINFGLITAEYDTQHFGSYTQYDDRGVAVRKYQETERGIHLVSEQINHDPGKYRVLPAPIALRNAPKSPVSSNGFSKEANFLEKDNSTYPLYGTESIRVSKFPNMPFIPGSYVPAASVESKIIELQVDEKKKSLKLFEVEVKPDTSQIHNQQRDTTSSIKEGKK